jgi:protein TonB
MAEGPKAHPRSAGPDALEELVYRAALSEDDRTLRGASPWLTVPVTLAVTAALGGLVFALGRRGAAGPRPPETVSVVLNEAPDGPAHAGSTPAPAAARPAPAPAPAPAAAPAPEVQPRQAPPPPREEAPPEAVPRELPKEDHSRQFGSSAAAVGAGTGGGTGTGTGSGPGAGNGTGTGAGTGGGRGGAGKVVDLTFSQVKVRFQPPKPDYPPLAKLARIQGSVVVQIMVGLDGIPISARAMQGPFQLRSSAETFALAWRFEPHMLDGVPQVSRFTLTVLYRLE